MKLQKIEKKNITSSTCEKQDIMDCYIVVTEEWYGGGSNKIRCFSTRAAATAYQNKLLQESNHKVDAVVMVCRKDDDTKCMMADEADDRAR